MNRDQALTERLRRADPLTVDPGPGPAAGLVLGDVLAEAGPMPSAPASRRSGFRAARRPGGRPSRPSRGRPGRRRRAAGFGALGVVLVATTAAGVVAVKWDPAQTTDVACLSSLDAATIVASTTGDPVVDCQAVWRRNGQEPPPLVAYDSGEGDAVQVLPASVPAPEGWVALAPGPLQDPRLIELASSLDDYVDGLNSRCWDEAGAVGVARTALSRLHLDGWEVDADDRGHPEGCFDVAITDAAAEEVTVVALSQARPPAGTVFGTDPTTAWAPLPGIVREVTATCRGTAAVEAAIRADGARARITMTEPDVTISVIPDPAATCTRADMVVGGAIRIILRGPQA